VLKIIFASGASKFGFGYSGIFMKRRFLLSALTLQTAFLCGETWNVDANGNWGTAANWNPATIPNAVDATAAFANIITAPRVVTLDINATVGTMTFDSGNNYSIVPTAGNALTFDITAAPAVLTITNVNGNGAHTVSVPITLSDDILITQSSTGSFTLSGVVSGAFSLTKAGTQTLVLGAVNTYTMGTIVNAGVLQTTIAGALPSSGALTVNGGSVTLGSFNQTVGVLGGAGGINLGSAQLTAASGLYSGVMSGTGSLIKNTAGTLTLSGVNTYSGGTTVSGGILQAGIANAFPPTGQMALTGGDLDLNNFNQSIGNLSGTGNITLGTATLTTTSTANTTYSGVISGATGAFVKAGTGVLSLTGVSTFRGGVTISGGTLQAGIADVFSLGAPLQNVAVTTPGIFDLNNFNQSVGTLTGTGSVTLGSAVLTTDTTTNATFSGVITGTGSLVKSNTSVFTLSGLNTYMGGTTVNAGTLQAGAVNTFPMNGAMLIAGGTLDLNNFNQQIGDLSGAGGVTLGTAQLTLNTTTTPDYGGVISGAGSVVKQGPGAQVFSGVNTYLGSTTILGGVLQNGTIDALPTGTTLTVAAPGAYNLNGFNQTVATFSGSGNVLLGAATLTTNTAGVSLYSGMMSGAGILVKQGAGVLILTGPNNYSGGTTVTAGTLQGNTVSLQGAIANAAAVVFDQTFDGTFMGTLSGAGTLVKEFGGNLILGGIQTQGNTLVNGGKLTVNGTLTSPVNVAPGGAIGGIGTILGNVNVDGLMQPGGVTGTLNITGSYTQGVNSTFEIDVTTATSDLLAVTGAVTINPGALVVVMPQVGLYPASNTYNLITATGGVAGTFADLIIENPFFDGTLLYSANLVQLLFRIAPFDTVITGGNAGAVAQCIDLANLPSNPDFLDIVQELIFLPLDEIRDALNLMQPSQLKSLVLSEQSNLVRIRSVVSQRLEEFYRTDCNQEDANRHRGSFWMDAGGNWSRQNSGAHNPGYHAWSATPMAGADVRLGHDLFLGAVGAYNYTGLTWERSRGDGNLHSGYVGPYVSWFGRNFCLNASALGSWNLYHSKRDIVFDGFHRRASNKHHGHAILGHLDAGLILHPTADVTLKPIGGVDWIHLHENGFVEKGAGSLDLKVQPSNDALIRTEAGLNISKCSNKGWGKWIHMLKASWIHEHRLYGSSYTAGFSFADCTFRVEGLYPTRDLLDVATSITGSFWDDAVSFSLAYEGLFGEGVSNQSGNFQLIFRF